MNDNDMMSFTATQDQIAQALVDTIMKSVGDRINV